MTTIESVILLPSQSRFVGPALAFIRAVAVSCNFSDSALNDIEVAAEEALTNVIKHAFEGSADETFKLSVGFTAEDFLITIFEKGMPFSPDRVAEFTPEKLQATLDPGGLGVYLMKKMMDEVRFENLGREGKSLTLVKHIKKSQLKAVLETNSNDTCANARPDHLASEISFDIRSFVPEDALEISRCAYKAYGYTYEPYIYYPEQITTMNQDGHLRSFVAVGRDNGEIMGHIALKYKKPADRISEIGVAFVKPEFRRTGVFHALMQFCHAQAVELKLYGLVGRAVTSHHGSQKVTDALGYQTCGMFLGLFPDDVDFKALTGKIRQKESGLLLYRPIFEDVERTIYLTTRHQDKIRELFHRFDIPVQHVENGSAPVCGKSRIEAEIIPSLNSADLEVCTVGEDFSHELHVTVHNLCVKHLDALFIHINLEDPCSPFVVQQSEKLGFFFAGVLPFGLNNRHELILQYLNNLEINYDIILPYAQSAVEMLHYIRQCDPDSVPDPRMEGGGR